MASFAVSGARLAVVRPGGSARSGGERRSGVDLPSVLFRRKDAFSRTVLSCAGAPGNKVLVVEEKAWSSAAQATSAVAEASSEVDTEEKPAETSEAIEGTDETDIDGAGMTARAPPGDGKRTYETNPMLEGFWCHLDYRSGSCENHSRPAKRSPDQTQRGGLGGRRCDVAVAHGARKGRGAVNVTEAAEVPKGVGTGDRAGRRGSSDSRIRRITGSSGAPLATGFVCGEASGEQP